MEWFKNYKVPTGKPENKFAFNAEAKGRLLALEIVEETHKHWLALVGQTAKPGSVSMCASSSASASASAFQSLYSYSLETRIDTCRVHVALSSCLSLLAMHIPVICI